MAITIEANRQAITIAIETFQLVGMAPILCGDARRAQRRVT